MNNVEPSQAELNHSEPNRKKRIGSIIWSIVFLILLVGIGLFYVNRRAIADIILGMFYQPSEEMVAIQEKLSLTGEGLRIFNASSPILESENEFNQSCESFDASIYILGCYAQGKIFVYNITDEQFDGIRELTAAHELLHAAYARLNDSERINLSVLLEEVYKNNTELLGSELSLYEKADRYDELHSRVGTEISELPSELEKYYGRYFKNQDLVVSYYDKYIKPFKEIKEKLDKLEGELAEMGKEIEARRKSYQEGSEEYNKKVGEFNQCANRVGCFSSESAFRTRRNELLDEQAKLNDDLDELNNLIIKYNKEVDEYNENVERNKELTDIINSNAEMKKIEEESEIKE